MVCHYMSSLLKNDGCGIMGGTCLDIKRLMLQVKKGALQGEHIVVEVFTEPP
jgi:hypothetical protein